MIRKKHLTAHLLICLSADVTMRIKGGVVTRRRKKRLFKQSKGFRLSNKNVYIHASERVDKALVNAYVGRKQKKRDKKSQWIMTLNAAARMRGLSYSMFISGIKKAGILINRKMLAEMAVSSPDDFTQLVNIAIQHNGQPRVTAD